MHKPKILVFDLESIVQPFTSGERLRAEDTAVVCFGYMWLDDKKAKCIHSGQFPADFKKDPFNDKKLLKQAADIILQADFIVAHYGSGFDKPMLRTRFILNGLDEAAIHLGRMKVIDTCIMARNILRVRSSSLKYLLQLFNLGSKMPMSASDWTGVMRSNKQAITKMAKYCCVDVEGLHALYLKIRGFAPNHPNLNFEKKPACPTCLSEWLVYPVRPWLEGKGRYQRVKCRKCGREHRGVKVK
jgi:hypothetical protein